jgi:hypothetical protein
MTVNKITSPISPKELIDKTNEIIDNLGGGSITVDTVLSTESENPVQNKAIANAVNQKASVTFVDWTV